MGKWIYLRPVKSVPGRSIFHYYQARPNTFEICSWLQQNIGKKKVVNQYQSLAQLINEWSSQHFPLHLMGNFYQFNWFMMVRQKKSIPAVSFPSDFVISANKKHYSNEREALNMLENIIIPYVEQRVSVNLDFDHPAFLIMDVFKGQMKCAVTDLLNENHILLERSQQIWHTCLSLSMGKAVRMATWSVLWRKSLRSGSQTKWYVPSMKVKT